MEIGPRSGGHFVPQAIKYSTGFDEVEAILDMIEGRQLSMPDKTGKCSAYYAIHSDYAGKLKHLSLKEDLKPFVKEFHQYHSPYSRIRAFKGANDAIGIVLMTFSNRLEMESIIEKMQSFVTLQIDTSETGSFAQDPPVLL